MSVDTIEKKSDSIIRNDELVLCLARIDSDKVFVNSLTLCGLGHHSEGKKAVPINAKPCPVCLEVRKIHWGF